MAFKLCVIAHSPSSNTELLLEALTASLSLGSLEASVHLFHVLKEPTISLCESIEESQGLVLFTTENFGYMSGGIKDFFDRCFYPLENKTQGLPFALCIRAGKDGTGAQRSVLKLTKALGWKLATEPLVLRGDYSPSFAKDIAELGEAFSVGVELGIF